MQNSQISVVIPLYNKKYEIKRALDSVLAQRDSNFEIIIVNDGSTDGSDDIVQTYTDSRIHLISQRNQGVSAARNTGIVNASGGLIAFLDADDEWDPGFLETIRSLCEKYPHAGIYGTAYYQKDTKTGGKTLVTCRKQKDAGILPSYFEAISLGPQPIMASGLAVPKTVFETVGTFSVGMKLGEDLFQWAKIALFFPVAYSPNPVATCWMNTENNHKTTAYTVISENIPFNDYLKIQNKEKFYESEDNISLYLSYLQILKAQEYAFANDKRKALATLKNAIHNRIFLKKIGCYLYIVLPKRLFSIVLMVTKRFTKIGQTLK